MQVGQRGLLRDKHLRQMWGLPPLSGATVLPSHLLQTHLFLLFCPPANKFCHQPKLHKTSKRHPQHGIKFCGGLLGSGWGRVVHPGRWWLIISDYPKYPNSTAHPPLGDDGRAYLGYFSRWPRSLSRWSNPRSICSSPINHLTCIPFHLQ